MILVLNLKLIVLIGLWSNDLVLNILFYWWKKKRSCNSKWLIVNYNIINGKFKSCKKFCDFVLKKKIFMKLKKNEKGCIFSKRDCKLLELF